MARFSQLGVAATRIALEDARVPSSGHLCQQAAICYGTSVNGVGDVAGENIAALVERGVRAMKPYPPHAVSSYPAIEFGVQGPALSVSSNCCTGLDAVNIAASQIAAGHTRLAIAGACDAPIFPPSFGAFCALGALTTREQDPRCASRPYDLRRDGLVISEGAATLILEDFEAAELRGAHIYAEVLGYGGASEALGMRKGDLEGRLMASAISAAIANAHLRPEDIDHVNAHGSSLPDYDICDSNSFKKALGRHAYHIPVASIKSMIGQPVSAAGSLQMAAACLSLEEQRVPPTINQEFPDPECDLDFVPNTSRVARLNHILINCHSFGGSVSALVIGRPERR